MSKIIVTNIIDSVFGNMAHITNGIVELKVSLDFGPRILHYSLFGMDNMFYNDLEMTPLNNIAYPEFGGVEMHKIYGGHRLVVAPEILPRVYYPDNAKVKMHETVSGIVLEAPMEQYNNIQKFIEIKLNEYNADVEVIHTIKNLGAWNTVFAPWGITIMAPGGVEIIPQANRDTGRLSNRHLGLWPYAKMNDERVYFGDKFIILRHNINVDREFKIGTNNEHGWAAYFNLNQLFIKHYEHMTDGFYPDFAECSFETYVNKDLLEIETLAPISLVEPNKFVRHIEKWTIYNESYVPKTNNEEEISGILDNYV